VDPAWNPSTGVVQQINVPGSLIEYVDDAVKAKLPLESKIISIKPFGASFWTRTAEIKTLQADGSPLSFFLKITQHETGKNMVHGEFVSMSAIYDAVPDFAPQPIAWGTYVSDPDCHFFLCEFVPMTDEIPDIEAFVEKLAEMHEKGISPTGKYGFPVPTAAGLIPLANTWTNGWEEFFSNQLREILGKEWLSQGPDDEILCLTPILFDRVIPRLLRPLETGGREIQPRLIHRDLWDGNASMNIEKDTPIIFDAFCCYSHSEAELGAWRPPRHQLSKHYIDAYFKKFQRSEPIEDAEGRNLLYALNFNVMSSALWVGNAAYRNIMVQDLRAVINMFPESYEEWCEARGETPCPRKS